MTMEVCDSSMVTVFLFLCPLPPPTPAPPAHIPPPTPLKLLLLLSAEGGVSAESEYSDSGVFSIEPKAVPEIPESGVLAWGEGVDSVESLYREEEFDGGVDGAVAAVFVSLLVSVLLEEVQECTPGRGGLAVSKLRDLTANPGCLTDAPVVRPEGAAGLAIKCEC